MAPAPSLVVLITLPSCTCPFILSLATGQLQQRPPIQRTTMFRETLTKAASEEQGYFPQRVSENLFFSSLAQMITRSFLNQPQPVGWDCPWPDQTLPWSEWRWGTGFGSTSLEARGLLAKREMPDSTRVPSSKEEQEQMWAKGNTALPFWMSRSWPWWDFVNFWTYPSSFQLVRSGLDMPGDDCKKSSLCSVSFVGENEVGCSTYMTKINTSFLVKGVEF